MMRINRLALAAGVALALMSTVAFAADKVTVAVTSIVEHPALNAARDGVKKALADAGYYNGETLKRCEADAITANVELAPSSWTAAASIHV